MSCVVKATAAKHLTRMLSCALKATSFAYFKFILTIVDSNLSICLEKERK